MNSKEIQREFTFIKLTPSSNLSCFDCGHKDTNDFLKNDALRYQKQNLGVTYTLEDSTGKVVGFVTLAMSSIKSTIPIVTVPNVSIHQYPALKIGQLGITKEKQGLNLGKYLLLASVKLADELKDKVGCRFVLVDSYPERVEFYKRYGFKSLYSETKERTAMPMYLVLK